MADLPPTRLRLFQLLFFSTGVDCFGPYVVKTGRRHEKRWGLIFKCTTTKCIHLGLIPSLNTDVFLLALKHLIFQRGRPSELLSDQGTNFRGAEKELKDAFAAMERQLRDSLAKYQTNSNSTHLELPTLEACGSVKSARSKMLSG